MKKNYLFIVALVLIVIIVDRLALPKGISYALGVALGYMIGAISWSTIKNRKKK
jgi:hypothetical protein